MPDIQIEWLGGNCPVQAEGAINGLPFYFRARGCRWTMEIAASAQTPLQYLYDGDGENWFHEEKWGEGPYDAGWMPEDTAREMIVKAAALWAAKCERTA